MTDVDDFAAEDEDKLANSNWTERDDSEEEEIPADGGTEEEAESVDEEEELPPAAEAPMVERTPEEQEAYDFAMRRWSQSRVRITNQEASDIKERTISTAIDRLSACSSSFSNPVEPVSVFMGLLPLDHISRNHYDTCSRCYASACGPMTRGVGSQSCLQPSSASSN